MNFFQAIILGIIQGLTEFLPISSTAHLTIANYLFGLNNSANPEKLTAFIATIQLGTLFAVILYFYKDIVNIIRDFFAENFKSKREKISNQSLNSRLGYFVIFGTFPIVIIGLGFKKIIEGTFTKDLTVIAFSLIILGIILFISEKTAKFKKDLKDISLKDAILVGLAQSVALIPGSSRSGTTLTAGLFLGMKREVAARFSFLLSIPAVLASGMLEFLQHVKFLTADELLNYVIATAFAFVSGYLTISFLLNFLKTKSTLVYVYYRVILGLAILLFLYF
jgi:undecaprenyl-diphosphatase